MKFRAPYRNKTYVVRPTIREVLNGFPQTRWGVKAVFRNGHFDSEKAQQEYHWDDETREMVEEYLLAHEDHGKPKGFYVDPERSAEDTFVVPEEVRQGDTCIATYETVDGAELCGRPTLAGQDYCKEHAPIREAV